MPSQKTLEQRGEELCSGGDVPISVMNGLIIGNKQSPEINDKLAKSMRDEPLDYRLD